MGIHCLSRQSRCQEGTVCIDSPVLNPGLTQILSWHLSLAFILTLILILIFLANPGRTATTEPITQTTPINGSNGGNDTAHDGLVFRPGDRTIEKLDAGEFAQTDHTNSCEAFYFGRNKMATKQNRDWTILFYDDADFNNAYDPIFDFSNDAYSETNLDVILLQDTNSGPAYIWHLPGNGVRTLLASMGELDMGDYTTLRDFIQYGKDNYPADRYLLCLYDHGGGYSGACVDQTCDPATALTMEDFQVAITETGGVDIIAFTAPCLMGSVECVYELRECVDVYVGSQDLSGFALWHGVFHDICDLLVVSDGISNEEIAAYMVQLVSENDYWPDPWYTMSAASSRYVGNLAQRIDELAFYLGANITEYSNSIELARESMWVIAQFYYDDFNRVDLASAVQELGNTIFDPYVQQKAAQILAAFNQTIIAEWHGENQIGAHGLSIYFPRLEGSYYDTYHTSLLDFADDLRWDEFLRAYYTGIPSSIEEFRDDVDLLVSNSPNPFQQSTRISFRNRTEGIVELSVFDVAGRLVQTLCNDPMGQGPQNLMWDGRDDRGRMVPSGIYFYRLQTRGYVKMKRMLLIR